MQIWKLYIRAGQMNLWLPLPLFVLTDLLVSLEDLCEVVLPRFGLPNYAAALRDFVQSLVELPWDTPLVDVKAKDAHIELRRINLGGE